MAGSFFATSARREERRVSADTQALSNDADTAKNASPEGSAGFGQFLRHSSSTYRKDTPSSSFLEPGANPALPLTSYAGDRTLEMAMKSIFIVLEGPDGSGTTLHTRLLYEKLIENGLDAISTFEPTEGPQGSRIRKILSSNDPIDPVKLQKMFVKDREWHIENVIEPALQKNKIVISDRYFHSTIAYGMALGIDKEILENMNKKFIQPDLTFFLLPPFEVCSERMKRREKLDSLEKEELQRVVYNNYLKMAEDDKSIAKIDTSGEKSNVARIIYEGFLKYVSEKQY